MKSLINFAAKKGVAWRDMVRVATVDSMQGTCAYDKRLMRSCSCKYTRRIYSSSRQRSVIGMSLQKPKDSLWLERGVTCSSLSESQRLAHIIKNARKLVAQMRKKRLAKMWISKASKVEYTLRKAKIEAMQSAGDKTTETTQNDGPTNTPCGRLLRHSQSLSCDQRRSCRRPRMGVFSRFSCMYINQYHCRQRGRCLISEGGSLIRIHHGYAIGHLSSLENQASYYLSHSYHIRNEKDIGDHSALQYLLRRSPKLRARKEKPTDFRQWRCERISLGFELKSLI